MSLAVLVREVRNFVRRQDAVPFLAIEVLLSGELDRRPIPLVLYLHPNKLLQ